MLYLWSQDSEMNNINNLRKKEINTDTYKYGLTILHSYIRFFECILHIAYRLIFKKWKVSFSLFY